MKYKFLAFEARYDLAIETSCNKILAQLVNDENVHIRIALTRNQYLSKDIFNFIIENDKDVDVKISCFLRGNTNIKIYNSFIKNIKNPSDLLRFQNTIATQADISVQLFKLLSKHNNFKVRLKIAQNFYTPSKIINVLCSDKSNKVQEAAKATKKAKDEYRSEILQSQEEFFISPWR